LPYEWLDSADSLLLRLSQWLQTAVPSLLGELAGRAGSLAMQVPSFVVGLIAFMMAAYFITADYPHLRYQVTRLFGGQARAWLSSLRDIFTAAFGGYLRAQLLLSVGVFFILLVGFLVTRQSYALLIALGLAVMDFIPIIGAGTVMVPWAVIALVTGQAGRAVSLMVIWGIICLFRRMAEPKFVGAQTGLSPVLSLISIYVGMRLAGVAGMILGPILCLVFQGVCQAGFFDGLVADLRLAAEDVSAILRNRP
jgi:sporulation integral membrane protein YtvI